MTELAKFGTATIHEAIGQRGALPSAIRALRPGMRLSGPAFPVVSPAGDNLMLHRAISHARTGHVIVADAGFDTTFGPWGDLMTLSAQAKGVAGLLLADTVRDSDEIAEYGFPVFCLGTAIRGTTKIANLAAPRPVSLGGIVVNEGDIIIGDADGVVVVPAEEEAEAVALCKERETKETNLRERMMRGESLQAIMGLSGC